MLAGLREKMSSISCFGRHIALRIFEVEDRFLHPWCGITFENVQILDDYRGGR